MLARRVGTIERQSSAQGGVSRAWSYPEEVLDLCLKSKLPSSGYLSNPAP